jgi:hypothetical protein
MASLVEQVQAEAMNLSVSVVGLLMKMKALATKLDLNELLEWVNRELAGYAETDDIPAYRMVQGEYKVWNPYHGWQPIFFPKSIKIPATRGVTSAIGELEGRVARPGELVAITLRPEEKASLVSALEVPMDVAWIANPSNVDGIVGAVRNVILEWSLKLEKLGIKGEGLTFSDAEKGKAQNEMGSINIAHVETLTAGVVGSQVLRHSSMSVSQASDSSINLAAVKQLVVQIKKHADDLPTESLPAIRRELNGLDRELESPDVNPSKIRATLNSIKNVLEGAAGNLIASGIVAELAKIVAH